ncbi:Asp-tRNA(Asn)/Glu-tRNA(Gln) amidotransferase subunit GatC [Desulfotomaculum varum]|uniref:Aspartyl/glutamyl-tRNA(Asn/Gln) amidotransferase subunit C n=1 Tax=Desulforamulus hydrothermalis Lam5 = DSM 18033 TaxID=1121428 RepID=K8E0Y4_9FIRM|nr:Asp-tRNA(Asn)/Glu-tRNA(Gln) amidotransferase subunit GatC [Desulforamulus hydrothermalis]CCO09250.1 Aspartyl/glutamyl-tRNA(Asn/Gln) amidotransferase subunit C [Desulforamulus hydrothermalis Lam5 = DSM 18033]SHH05613.1 aspartyl/glutamyl-tRNA(Asn/Gln) amidotransferase subunit C [Desulforamulus hydrothermalis Lam5 = DSM 18033]
MISKQDVEHVALLARLELNEEEKELYTRQLNKILEAAKALQELATDNVPPTAHVLPLQNVFREDRVGPHIDPEKALANAPEREDCFFKVPKIV